MQHKVIILVKHNWFEFTLPSPRPVVMSRFKGTNQLCYFFMIWLRMVGFIPFPKLLVLCGIQKDECRIWTCVTGPISFDSKRFCINTSTKINGCQYLNLKQIIFRRVGRGSNDNEKPILHSTQLKIWTHLSHNQDAFSIALSPFFKRCNLGPTERKPLVFFSYTSKHNKLKLSYHSVDSLDT